MKIDTLRIILFKECNMKCSYCCNEQEKFSSQFTPVTIDELTELIPNYKNICITGGEPLLKPDLVKYVTGLVPRRINLYLYTNGLRFDTYLVEFIRNNFTGVNIGIHTKKQLELLDFEFIRELVMYVNVRLMVEDKNVHKDWVINNVATFDYLIKPWTRNNCEMPNENWVILEDR